MKKENLNLLNNPEVVRWCYEGVTDISLKNTNDAKKLKESKKIEDEWGVVINGLRFFAKML